MVLSVLAVVRARKVISYFGVNAHFNYWLVIGCGGEVLG